MTTLLSRLSIRFQIMTIAALGMAGLLVVLGVYWNNWAVQDRLAAEDRVASTAFADASRAGMQLNAARVLTNIFMDTRDPAVADRRARELAQVRAALERLAAVASTAEDVTDNANLRAAVDAWEASFKAMQDTMNGIGQTEKDGLQGALGSAARDAEQRLADAAGRAPDEAWILRLQMLMLQMRQHEKDLILRSDADYRDSMAQRQREFERALADAPLDEAGRAAIAKPMADYQRAFDTFTAAHLSLVAHKDKVRVLGAATVGPFEKLLANMSGDLEETRNHMAENRDQTFTVMAASILVTALLAGLASALLGQGIAGPVGRMTTAMQAIAANDLSTPVPALERRDEIGRMARTLEVFKDGAAENARLRAGQERSRAAAEEEKRRMLTQLADDFEKSVNAIVQGVVAAATQTRSSAEQMTATAVRASERASTAFPPRQPRRPATCRPWRPRRSS